MRRIYLLILVASLMFGCSSIKKLSEKDKEDMARANLAYLNNFKSSGVVDISMKEFSIKKEFFLKNS